MTYSKNIEDYIAVLDENLGGLNSAYVKSKSIGCDNLGFEDNLHGQNPTYVKSRLIRGENTLTSMYPFTIIYRITIRDSNGRTINFKITYYVHEMINFTILHRKF